MNNDFKKGFEKQAGIANKAYRLDSLKLRLADFFAKSRGYSQEAALKRAMKYPDAASIERKLGMGGTKSRKIVNTATGTSGAGGVIKKGSALGLDKEAGAMDLVRKGGKMLGRATGFSQLKTGLKQTKRGLDKGQLIPGVGTTKPKMFGPTGSVEKRLRSGGKRMAGTVAATGAAAYGAKKMSEK